MATIDKEELPTEEFLLDEKTLREIETMKGAGQWSIVWRRIKKDKMGMLGFYIVLFLIAMAFVSWVLLTFDNWLTVNGFMYRNPHPGFEGSRNNLYIELWFTGMDIENPIILFQHPRYMDHANAKLPLSEEPDR